MGNWVVKGEKDTWGCSDDNVHSARALTHTHRHTQTSKHSPIVALGLVLSPSMLGPSSGTGSHGQEMFTSKSNDNDVLMVCNALHSQVLVVSELLGLLCSS